MSLDGGAAKAQLDKDGYVSITVSTGEIQLGAEDLLIETKQTEGFESVSDNNIIVALDTHITPELLEEAPKAIARIVENTAAAYGATAKLAKFEWLVVPVINADEKLVKIGQEAVKKMYGEETLRPMITQMGGEDFSYYMRKVPGVFAFIGSHNPETGKIYSNHHEKYDVDEEVLKRGAAVYAQFAHDFLAE